MKTTSGAHVFTYDGRAVKVAMNGNVRRRLTQQAAYATYLGSAVCPVVERIVPGGYVMERLEAYPDVVTSRGYVNDVVGLLETHVWNRSSQSAPQTWTAWLAHFDYVMDRIDKYAPHLKTRTMHMMQALDLEPCRKCLTHGDPTLDNMMLRKQGAGHWPETPVIIDPLPPRFEMPEMMAVDVGKIIQSLLGYETIKYRRYRMDWTETVENRLSELWTRLEDYPLREWRAATYFAYVHCLRLLPYQSEEKRPLFVALAQDAFNLAAKSQVMY